MQKPKQLKKKILIDLDAVTVAIWDKKGKQVEIANKFIERVEKGEFYIINPFFLIELALKWRHEKLREDIKEFYINCSNKLISDNEFKEKIKELKLDTQKIIKLLENHYVKEEDSVLVLITSIFDIDYLVTFNRKHLKNKKHINGKLHDFHFNLNLLNNASDIKALKNTINLFLCNDETKIDAIIDELNDFKTKLDEIKRHHKNLLPTSLDNKLNIESKYGRHIEKLHSIHKKQKNALISTVKLFLKLAKRHLDNLKRFKNKKQIHQTK